ncbi:MAG TPA: TIGR01906 family membrane protein [Aggregatilineaceae bacterium]|nr:TIGR01906 family membrane protein [Aggregatilineaceae bacterium]
MGTPDTPPAVQEPLSRPRALPDWLTRALGLFLVSALPAFLLLTSVRIVMSQAFLRLEYNRPGFPADPFGFTKADRLQYAPYAVRYLLNNAGISYLGDLTFDNGAPLFTDRELQHMHDVKHVTRVAFRVHLILGLALAAVIVLLWRRQTLPVLWRGLSDGALLAISLIIALVILALTAWNFFFDNFHRILFKGDSWEFSTSDSLIRLFPQQFWFDAALSIGVLTLLGAALIITGTWYWEHRLSLPHNSREQRDIHK